jgi:hypothetical protein
MTNKMRMICVLASLGFTLIVAGFTCPWFVARAPLILLGFGTWFVGIPIAATSDDS